MCLVALIQFLLEIFDVAIEGFLGLRLFGLGAFNSDGVYEVFEHFGAISVRFLHVAINRRSSGAL